MIESVQRHRPFAKYLALIGVAVRYQLVQRGAVFGRVAFYAMILFIFSRLWEVVFEQSPLAGLTQADMIWYLAVTEWALMSVPASFLEIEKDVRNGDIAYRLPRPISYLWAQIAEGLGNILVRMVILGVLGFAIAYLFLGELPRDVAWLLFAIPLGFLSMVAMLLAHIGIGLCAIWIHDITPVFWIWQKMLFILGGLMLPLTIYPEWLVAIAEWTPFYAMLYGVGQFAYTSDISIVVDVALKLLAWLAILLVVVSWIYRKGLKALNISGG